MAKPSILPSQATENAADQAQSHLPTSLPPEPPTPPTVPGDVTPNQHAIDAVTEHVELLGAAPHLPDFFGLG